MTVIGLDGNHDHVGKLHTLVSLGWYDIAHHYHVMALGVFTGKEAELESGLFLRLVSRYMDQQVGKPIPADVKWMLDGHDGLRGQRVNGHWD